MLLQIQNTANLLNTQSALRARINAAMARWALETADEARRNAPVASSLLQQGVRPLRINDFEHHVVAGQSYTAAVEDGQEPGTRVHPAKLEQWLKMKGIEPRNPAHSRLTVAFFISRHIYQYGTEGTHFMANAAAAKQARGKQLLTEALSG